MDTFALRSNSSWIFHCQSLRNLKLAYFVLSRPPSFGRFFSLVTLRLFAVCVSSRVLGNIISRCRKFENLYFKCSVTMILENVPPLTVVSLGHCMAVAPAVERSKVSDLIRLLCSLSRIEGVAFPPTLV